MLRLQRSWCFPSRDNTPKFITEHIMCKEHERYYKEQAISDNMIETLEAQIAAEPQNVQLYWYLAPEYRVRKWSFPQLTDSN